jgi:hypothetical protein
MNSVDAQYDAEKSKHPKAVGQFPDSLCAVYWALVIPKGYNMHTGCTRRNLPYFREDFVC